MLLRAAPQIIGPMRFVMPHDEGQRPAGRTCAGLFGSDARYIMRAEFARTAEDILWRRTKLGLGRADEDVGALQRWIGRHRAGLGDQLRGRVRSRILGGRRTHGVSDGAGSGDDQFPVDHL